MSFDKELNQNVRKLLAAFPPRWSHPNCRGPHFITDSEFKVLELVAHGKTNLEIATKLFISPLTVRTHVKHIHAKSGIVGRARLAITAYHAIYSGIKK